MTLHVRTAANRSALAALSDDWRALAAAAPAATVFQTYEWNAAWWRHFGRGRPLRVEDAGHHTIERLGLGDALQPVLHHTQPQAVAAVPAIRLARINRAQVGAVRQHLLARQPQVAFDAPEQVGAGARRAAPERVAEEVPIGQAQHAGDCQEFCVGRR